VVPRRRQSVTGEEGEAGLVFHKHCKRNEVARAGVGLDANWCETQWGDQHIRIEICNDTWSFGRKTAHGTNTLQITFERLHSAKEYVIAVSESEVVWTVQYRYSEILRFHNQVRIFHVVSINHYSKPIYP